MISNGAYDFGKSLIESVKYIQKDYDKALTEIKDKKQETITKAKKAINVIGIGNTINSINIEISAGNGEQENFSIDQDFMKTTNQGIKSAIEGVYEEIKINKRREELFESVELKFKTVSEPNTDGTYINETENSIHSDYYKALHFKNNHISSIRIALIF